MRFLLEKSGSRIDLGSGPTAPLAFCSTRSTRYSPIQTPNEVAMIWGQEFQLRHVYLNLPRTSSPKPSWYGESVVHYENGDILVVDTIGFNDSFTLRTPVHSRCHGMRVSVTGATGVKEEVPLREMGCAERTKEDHFIQGLVRIPQADKAEF